MFLNFKRFGFNRHLQLSSAVPDLYIFLRKDNLIQLQVFNLIVSQRTIFLAFYVQWQD